MGLFQAVDLKLAIPSLFLLLAGAVTLSSVSPGAFPGQFLHIGLAILVFILFANIDVKVLKEFGFWLYGFSLLLLLLTLFLGIVTRGSVRWISLGPLTVQPTEIVKPFLLVFFAWFATRKSRFLPKTYLFALALLFPAVFLVLLQPDLGSGLIITAGSLGVLLFSGFPLTYFFLSSVIALLATPFLWHFLAVYQKQRIISFLHPQADPLGAGYNSIQAMIAVGSGGLFGRGLGQGTQSQLAFLPERHTDFIFASLSEELGFLGAALVVISFAALFLHLINLIKNEQDSFYRALLGGIFLLLFTQTAVNIGMNLGLLPITGIPLPLVSSGGSSLVATSATLGIVSAASLRKRQRSAILS